MHWLKPVSEGGPVTMGHRFRALGYETAYIGKWHLSHDAHVASGKVAEQSGANAWGLEDYGFGGWVGPEPHGADPRNSGLQRDAGYVAEAERFLRGRAQGVQGAQGSASDDDKPFLLVVSLVNPHDIVFWPSWWIPQLVVLVLSLLAFILSLCLASYSLQL